MEQLRLAANMGEQGYTLHAQAVIFSLEVFDSHNGIMVEKTQKDE